MSSEVLTILNPKDRKPDKQVFLFERIYYSNFTSRKEVYASWADCMADSYYLERTRVVYRSSHHPRHSLGKHRRGELYVYSI